MENIAILAVDDNASCLQLVMETCEIFGAFIKSASSGEEALRILERGQFSLLLTDLEMPGMDGFQLAALAKAICPTLRIVMMNGNLRPEQMHLLSEVGIDGVMGKPFNLETLKKTLGIV